MPDGRCSPSASAWAVIAYVKGFYPEWERSGSGSPISMPPPPATLGSRRVVARGSELYVLLECSDVPRRRGPRRRSLGRASSPPDAWGNPQQPFDFTQGRLKSGPTRRTSTGPS